MEQNEVILGGAGAVAAATGSTDRVQEMDPIRINGPEIPAVSVVQWHPSKKIKITLEADNWPDAFAALAQLEAHYAKSGGVPKSSFWRCNVGRAVAIVIGEDLPDVPGS